MAFRINEPKNAVLLHAAAKIASLSEASAVDGMRIIFQTLAEASDRLKEKLDRYGEEQKGLQFTALTNDTARQSTDGAITFSRPNVGLNSVKDIDVSYGVRHSSIMADVWILLDNIHRLDILLKFVPGPIVGFSRRNFMQLMNSVTGIRGSFHHIDERIKRHFAKVGGSAFGDVNWVYNSSDNHPALFIMHSGVDRFGMKNTAYGAIEGEDKEHEIGAHNLELRYLMQDRIPGTKADGTPSFTWGTPYPVSVNFDDLAALINELQLGLEHRYASLAETAIKPGEVPVLPGIQIIRRRNAEKPD